MVAKLRLLLAAAASSATLAWSIGPSADGRQWSTRAVPEPPNFVFVLADDWGWGDVGFTGSNTVIHTPNLDHIATHGITFTDIHVSWQRERERERRDGGRQEDRNRESESCSVGRPRSAPLQSVSNAVAESFGPVGACVTCGADC